MPHVPAHQAPSSAAFQDPTVTPVSGKIFYSDTTRSWFIRDAQGVDLPLTMARPVLAGLLATIDPEDYTREGLRLLVKDLDAQTRALVAGQGLTEREQPPVSPRTQRFQQQTAAERARHSPQRQFRPPTTGQGTGQLGPAGVRYVPAERDVHGDPLPIGRQDELTTEPGEPDPYKPPFKERHDTQEEVDAFIISYFGSTYPPGHDPVLKGVWDLGDPLKGVLPGFRVRNRTSWPSPAEAVATIPPSERHLYEGTYSVKEGDYVPTLKKVAEEDRARPMEEPNWAAAEEKALSLTAQTGRAFKARTTNEGRIIVVEVEPDPYKRPDLPKTQQAHIIETFLTEGPDAALLLDSFYDQVNADPYVEPTLSLAQKMNIAEFAARNTTTEEEFASLFNDLTGGVYTAPPDTTQQHHQAAEATAWLHGGSAAEVFGLEGFGPPTFTGIPSELDPSLPKGPAPGFKTFADRGITDPSGAPFGETPPTFPGGPTVPLPFGEGAGVIDLSGKTMEQMQVHFGEGFGAQPGKAPLPSFAQAAFGTQALARTEAEAAATERAILENQRRLRGGRVTYGARG